MLVNSKKMLEEAKAGHYAVPAANIVNLENIKGVIEAAEETKHPLMVCLAEVHTPTLGIEEAAAIVNITQKKVTKISRFIMIMDLRSSWLRKLLMSDLPPL